MRITADQIKINDIIFGVGYRYDSNKTVTKIIVTKLELNKDLIINDHYYLYNRGEYFENNNIFFSEKKANNVITNWIEISNKTKEKYKKQDIQRQKYEDIIKNDNLEEKYINKNIMIFRDHKWIKTSVKRIYATHNDIYLVPKLDGHICKMSRESKTWKWWSEIEELEMQKIELENKIKQLKENNTEE